MTIVHQMMVDPEAAEDEMLNTPAQQRSEPEEEVSDSMMMSTLTDSIAKLSERDQIIMALYYTYEEMNPKAIGAVLDISESRVSQFHTAHIVQEASAADGFGNRLRKILRNARFIWSARTEMLKQDARKRIRQSCWAERRDTCKEHAYRILTGLRARSHIDKLFIDGAKKAEKYNETVMLNISQGCRPGGTNNE